MAQIYNSDAIQALIRNASIQTSNDKVPSQLADKIVPVLEVNPSMQRVVNVCTGTIATNAASATIYTTPSDQDFYLTAANISLIKDATATSILSNIGITLPNGSAQRLLPIQGFTLTAQQFSYAISFDTPILLKRNTNVIIENSTNVANISCRATIMGYTVGISNA